MFAHHDSTSGFTPDDWAQHRGRFCNYPPRPTTRFIGQPEVAGALDEALVRRYVKRNAKALGACNSASRAGTVTVELTIKPDGTVERSTATGLPDVSRCIAQVITNIKFPASSNGGNVHVTYPFTW